jgi:hypothetical protein
MTQINSVAHNYLSLQPVTNLITGLDVEELTQCGKITLIKTKNRDTEIDTKIMDIQIGCGKDLNTNNTYICCMCACSDGIVRALRYCFKQRKFDIISLLEGNGHGVMKLQTIANHASTLDIKWIITSVEVETSSIRPKAGVYKKSRSNPIHFLQTRTQC